MRLTLALGAVAGVSLAGTLFPHQRLAAAGVVVVSLAIALARSRVRVPAPPLPAALALLERWAPLSTLLFFIPVLTHAVAPGADMAMHAALARFLGDGHLQLSPAWGTARAAAYPLGFSAWIALLSKLIGIAHASVLASAASYALYYLGLQRVFTRVLRLPLPQLTAAFVLLASWTPQAFYRWGGGPSVLAMALGLAAAAEVVHATRPAVIAFIALLLTAAMATHPIGASIGAAISGMTMLWHIQRARFGPLALAPMLALMLWLSRGGPLLSPRELDFIHHFQTVDENVLGSWPRWLFPLTVWRAAFVRVGPVVSICYVASCALLWNKQRRLVLATLAIIEAFGLILAYGERLPVLGFLVYPSRLMPALLLPLAPPLAAALMQASQRRALLGILGLAAVSVHIGLYQLAEPLVSRNDLAVLQCLDHALPPNALIEGAYGDATQWVPALTGRAVTRPHVHCSLFDEVDAQLQEQHPTHRLVGERVVFGDPVSTPLPNTQPLCQQGSSRLYRY